MLHNSGYGKKVLVSNKMFIIWQNLFINDIDSYFKVITINRYCIVVSSDSNVKAIYVHGILKLIFTQIFSLFYWNKLPFCLSRENFLKLTITTILCRKPSYIVQCAGIDKLNTWHLSGNIIFNTVNKSQFVTCRDMYM